MLKKTGKHKEGCHGSRGCHCFDNSTTMITTTTTT